MTKGLERGRDMLCKNKRCMRPMDGHYWGDGFCSERCYHDSISRADGVRDEDYLSDPTDPTGRRAIARTRDEIDAMLDAFDIDARLPKIIYLRRRGYSLRAVGKACHISYQSVDNILDKLTTRMLHSVGL